MQRVTITAASVYDEELQLRITTSKLRITDLNTTDEGGYMCVGMNGVNNHIGAVGHSSAFLVIQGNK